MISVTDPKDCCGCTACESICPVDAISMQPDAMGFLYPVADALKCTGCGMCDKVCAFDGNYDKSRNFSEPLAFASRHRDMKEIAASQSGAVFAALSDYILERKGVVYGAGYDGHFRVVHKRASGRDERDEFRGSKYVQSDMGGCFRQIRDDLRQGKTVMFSGTPCQTAGLVSFIGDKLRENLYLMDLVCHGVPSPGIWEDYLCYLEKRENLPIAAVNFRDKGLKGWRSHIESFQFANTRISYECLYTDMFSKHIMSRKSCHNCPYTNTVRPSDITAGDFWGIERSSAAAMGEDNKGCSLMLVNTEKGKAWFDEIQDRLQTMPAVPHEYLQPNLRSPSAPHPQRESFENDYAVYGFEKTLRKYGFIGWKRVLRDIFMTVKSIVPRPVRTFVRKIAGI